MDIPHFEKKIAIGITDNNKVKYIKDIDNIDDTKYKKIIIKTVTDSTLNKIHEYYQLIHKGVQIHKDKKQYQDDFNQYLAQTLYNDPDFIDNLKGDSK